MQEQLCVDNSYLMRIVPIVFAFDRHLIFPAGVCLSSLMMNARKDTFYDIFILYSDEQVYENAILTRIIDTFNNCRIQYRKVDNVFDQSFEVRGITTSAYHRLLIPELIPEYDKILYSDVDVIFRDDLSYLYNDVDMEGCYLAGVDSLANLIPDMKEYYESERRTDSRGNIYSGNLIMNSKKMREDGVVDEFKKHVDKKYQFQDMDIINLVCKNKIKYLPPFFCYTTYIADFAAHNRDAIKEVWTEEQIKDAQDRGIVHYNGQKPWKGACINFDIWWEYYRKSPFYDQKYYYDFFDNMLNELERLPLSKRIKILLRYFVYGKK